MVWMGVVLMAIFRLPFGEKEACLDGAGISACMTGFGCSTFRLTRVCVCVCVCAGSTLLTKPRKTPLPIQTCLSFSKANLKVAPRTTTVQPSMIY